MRFAPEILAALLAALFAGGLALWSLDPLLMGLRRCRASLSSRPGGFWRGAALSALADANERRLPRRQLDRLDRELLKAGRPMELKPAELIAGVEACAILFFGLGVGFARWTGLGFGACLAFTLFGAAYPLLWLRDKVRQRHRAIARALPYDLDLLTLSVEAGLDFAAALAKVVEKGRKGPLASELAVTLRELKLGKTREEALRNLGRRVGLPALTSFVQALIQADRLGTSLGKVLRILSTQMRQDRTQRAEKLANEAPVKLLLPLIGCIFPTIFLMLFGPIAYQVFFGGSF
jgi:tight adherence protein C